MSVRPTPALTIARVPRQQCPTAAKPPLPFALFVISNPQVSGPDNGRTSSLASQNPPPHSTATSPCRPSSKVESDDFRLSRDSEVAFAAFNDDGKGNGLPRRTGMAARGPLGSYEMSTTQVIAIDKNDVDNGKLFAILSYLVPFFFLVPLIQKTNTFSHFHARQALAFVLLAIALSIVTMLLPLSLLGIVSPVLLLAQLALIVIGIIHAANGHAKHLPLIGQFADLTFRKVGL